MCELMGMSFAKPIVANVSIRAFSLRSEENADGWGLAWYPDRSLAMVKQPLRWSVQHTQFLDSYPGLLSSIYVAHVRKQTTGQMPTHADTHPFARELGGREYCFAHNGTLRGAFWQLPRGRFRPVGHTDSELLFCLLLAELERFARLATEIAQARMGNGHTEPPADADTIFTESSPAQPEPAQNHLHTQQQWRWLHRWLLHMNDYGRLNCILADCDRLIVYRDKNGWKNLTYRKIFLHAESPQHFGDETMALSLPEQAVNHGCIVATNPLSSEGWQQLVPGEMKVIQNGNILFTEHTGLPSQAPLPTAVHVETG